MAAKPLNRVAEDAEGWQAGDGGGIGMVGMVVGMCVSALREDAPGPDARSAADCTNTRRPGFGDVGAVGAGDG